MKISTHTSLTGRDVQNVYNLRAKDQFLLTRPSRDVTTAPFCFVPAQADFYSHVPHGT